LENLEEMDKFLGTCDHSKLNQEDINHLSRSRRCNKIEAAMKNLPKKKSPGIDELSPEFYQTITKEHSLYFSRKWKGKKHSLIHFMKPVLHLSQNWTHLKRRTTLISLMSIDTKALNKIMAN
jgi:hypothetical protein